MAQITLHADDNVKHSTERTLNDIGLSMAADPFYSEKNISELERRVANIHTGKSILKEHKLIEVDE